MNKHTPAPWFNDFKDGNVNDKGGLFVASCYTSFRGDETIRANAKLIAAAPELLENEVKNLEFLEWVSTKAREFNMWSDKVQQLHERISLTKTAIKKATE